MTEERIQMELRLSSTLNHEDDRGHNPYGIKVEDNSPNCEDDQGENSDGIMVDDDSPES